MSVYEYANELVYEGCYRDSKSNRVMGDKTTNPDMTNEVSPPSLHKRFFDCPKFDGLLE